MESSSNGLGPAALARPRPTAKANPLKGKRIVFAGDEYFARDLLGGLRDKGAIIEQPLMVHPKDKAKKLPAQSHAKGLDAVRVAVEERAPDAVLVYMPDMMNTLTGAHAKKAVMALGSFLKEKGIPLQVFDNITPGAAEEQRLREAGVSYAHNNGNQAELIGKLGATVAGGDRPRG